MNELTFTNESIHASEDRRRKDAKVVLQKGDLTVIDLGLAEFGPEIVVADPCYHDGEGGPLKALPGKWRGFSVIRNIKWWGDESKPHERTAMLMAVHESKAHMFRSFMRGAIPAGLSRAEDGRGVDSGQMCIRHPDFDASEEHYDEICGNSDLGNNMGGHAFVSDTGLGDGGYPMKVWTDDQGRTVAVTVRFWRLKSKD